MEYLVISDGLDYKIVGVLETHKNQIQVEDIATQQKKKIKTTQQLYVINTNNINQFINDVTKLQQTLDIGLIFELIEDTITKFTIYQLADLYFGDSYTQIEITALLMSLANNRIDFNNNLNGSFNKCTEEERAKRKFIVNKKQLELTEFNKYYSALGKLEKPDIEINILQFLHRPDKHAPFYHALTQASRELSLSGLELCHKVGLIPKIEDFFVYCFMQENFPKGLNYNELTHEEQNAQTMLAPSIDVFSIDDANTTEVDDAFSVQLIDSGYIIGIHIAAPALNADLIDMACNNLSTIYYPGHKVTMFPEEIINQYSLDEGKTTSVVSIYFNLDSEFNILDYESRLETVTVNANLRIESLEELFNNENLTLDHNYPYEKELKILYTFAGQLEEKRGKPSTNSITVDYSFAFEKNKVILKPRQRGNPIDKLVSELMILANCTWGRMLTNAFIPAIYRVKQPNYPVKMTLQPDSHTGLNVDYYTWATSPLRRAVDYINQKQIINLITSNKNHYTGTSPELLDVAENFDTTYAKYIDFQNKMERYWSLEYLLQEKITEVTGTFVFKSKVQLDHVPIEIDTQNLITHKPKGTEVTVKLFNINPINLTFDFKVLES
jgi:exoribonuclease II